MIFAVGLKEYFHLGLYAKQMKIWCNQISKVLLYLFCPTQWPIVPRYRSTIGRFFCHENFVIL